MINALNRVGAVVGLLTLLACSVLGVIGVLVPPLWRPLRDRWMEVATLLIQFPDALSLGQRLLFAGMGGLVAVVAFLMLVLELRPQMGEPAVRVKAEDGSQTVISHNAIAQRLRHAVSQLDDVVAVEPAISGKASGLTVRLAVTTKPYIDVPLKSDEIRAVTREVVEKQMGLTLKQALVRIDHEAFGDPLAGRL